MLKIILTLLIATSTAVDQKYLWNPINGFLNLTSPFLSYSKTSDASLKVSIFKLVNKKTIKWCHPIVKGYYFLNNKRQAICLQRSNKEVSLTHPLKSHAVLNKNCIWRVRYQKEKGVLYKRLFVKNKRNPSCRKFYLGQGCSSNDDDSLFLLHVSPWIPYKIYTILSRTNYEI